MGERFSRKSEAEGGQTLGEGFPWGIMVTGAFSRCFDLWVDLWEGSRTDLLSDLRMDFIFQAISQRMISLAFRSQSIRSSGFPFAAVGKAHSLFLLRGVSPWACEYKISPFGQRDKLQPSSSLMQGTRNPDRSFFGTALLKPVPNKIIHRPSITSHQGRQVDIDRWLLGHKASWLGGRNGKGNGGKGREYCNR